MFHIRAELPADTSAVEHLNDLGFGTDRKGRTVWRLRQGPVAEGLAFVADDPIDGRVLATIRFWQVDVGRADAGQDISAVLLGPLAVCPTMQGQGLGRALVSHGLQAARDGGWDICLVSGEPSYYLPFGFEPAPPYGFEMPGPLKAGWLQVRDLKAGALDALPRKGTRPIRPWRWVRGAGDVTALRAAG
ncbi:GNAT family N-acetyltransferase [Thalassobaculum salexigens]|uniref:GNAT family N-acetyltransferase n=1 Tax=Thalassobaculum salexigens TaxID=455360 RepID=UPI0012ECA19A|nr:N-acetyltransferase [Thalassobaculum salexigens]